jgi:hypothetical protein
LIASIIVKLGNDRRILLKMVLRADCLINPLCIVGYDCKKMYEWLLGDEYGVCHHVLHFLLYLDCKELYGAVKLYDIVEC